MTVAVGFTCHNGVVLAADTQISFGTAGKRTESKIFCINEDLGFYLAYSGNSDFAKEFISNLKKQSSSLSAETAVSIARYEYDQMTVDHAEMTAEERLYAGADFLLTLRGKDDGNIHGHKAELHLLRGKHCYPIQGYMAIGIGEEQAAQAFEPLYSQFTGIHDAVYSLIYGVRRVKQNTQAVGGATQLETIFDNPNTRPVDLGATEIASIEAAHTFLEQSYKRLIAAFPMPIEDERFAAALGDFGDKLIAYRAANPPVKLY